MIKNESCVHLQGWMYQLGLNDKELLVYATIYSFTNWTSDHCYHWSAWYLSEWALCSRRNIVRILKRLEELWLIIKKERYVNGIKFVDYFTGWDATSQGDETWCHEGGWDVTSHHNNRAIDKDREDNIYNGHFEEFWRLYPKKRKKSEARKKFMKIKESELDKMISWLNRYIEYWRRKGTEMQYIPDPTTWINQERWNDELESSNNAVIPKKVPYNMPDISKMSMEELKAFTWFSW